MVIIHQQYASYEIINYLIFKIKMLMQLIN